MISVEYANAYTEVLEILKYISQEDYQKIPQSKITLLEQNANYDYFFFYNPIETLENQNVSKIAKTIIAIFFRDYWANDIQRQKIITFQKNTKLRLEEEKIKIYNSSKIFKNKIKTENYVDTNFI